MNKTRLHIDGPYEEGGIYFLKFGEDTIRLNFFHMENEEDFCNVIFYLNQKINRLQQSMIDESSSMKKRIDTMKKMSESTKVKEQLDNSYKNIVEYEFKDKFNATLFKIDILDAIKTICNKKLKSLYGKKFDICDLNIYNYKKAKQLFHKILEINESSGISEDEKEQQLWEESVLRKKRSKKRSKNKSRKKSKPKKKYF